MARKVWKDNRVVVELDGDDKQKIEAVKRKMGKSETVTHEDLHDMLETIIKILTA